MIVLADTGPLVALIDPDTREHEWVRDHAKVLPRPLLTSEPVLTEAAFLGTTRYSYDAAGQVLWEDGPWADDTVSYAYANRPDRSRPECD